MQYNSLANGEQYFMNSSELPGSSKEHSKQLNGIHTSPNDGVHYIGEGGEAG